MAAASRRLFSAESFSLLVEPAIADLQIENSGRIAERFDAYRTVWVGMAAACDDGVARRARAFVRDNELVTLAALVLLLGLDGRVHLKRLISAGLSEIPTPGVLAVASVVALYAGRALVMRLLTARTPSAGCSVVRVSE